MDITLLINQYIIEDLSSDIKIEVNEILKYFGLPISNYDTF